MTNQELNDLFIQISIEADNIFDAYLMLQEHVDDYSQMAISSIIPTIFEAYEVYFKHEDMVVKIVKAIGNADWSHLIEGLDIEELFKQIPDNYKDTLIQLIKDEIKEI